MSAKEKIGLFIDKITKPEIIAVFAVLVSLFLYFSSYIYESIVFITVFTATVLINFLLKIVFRIPRPKEALVKLKSYSLPSGHSAGATAFAVLISFILFINGVENSIIYSILLFAIAFFVGISRLFIRVHTGYQVYVGFAIGLIVPLLSLLILINF